MSHRLQKDKRSCLKTVMVISNASEPVTSQLTLLQNHTVRISYLVFLHLIKHCSSWLPQRIVEGDRGRATGRKGGGRCTGSGITKVVGSRRQREQLRNIAQYFAIEKMQLRGGGQQIQGRNWEGYGKREIWTPCTPFPCIHRSKSRTM